MRMRRSKGAPLLTRVAGHLALKRLGVPGTLAALGARLLPSTLVLTQWLPDGPIDVRAIPHVCRWRGPADSSRQIALTFDDGPDPDSTPATLELLDRLGMRATFFCLGSEAEKHPELVEETMRRGHEVAMHGYEHDRHVVHSRRWIHADLARGLEMLERLDARPRFFRPPYGLVAASSISASRKLGLELVLWSAWGREWSDRDAASVACRIESRLVPGAIVLLHDSDSDAPEGTAERGRLALEQVAATIESRRLEPVTMSELVGG